MSRVFSGKGQISEKTREKVLMAARALNYVSKGSGGRSTRLRFIALLVPDVSNPFFAEVAKGVEDAAIEMGYHVILGNTSGNDFEEERYIKALVNTVEGFILAPITVSGRNLGILKMSELPVVVVDRHVEDTYGADQILVDYFKGTCDAIQHLLSLGHERIGFISGPLETKGRMDAFSAYKRTLAANGITTDEQLVRIGSSVDFEEGRILANSLLSLQGRPTALFAVADVMAVGAMRAADELGLKIPGDVAIVGFDNIFFPAALTPALTTVAHPKYEMGRLAMEMLIQRITSGEQHPTPRQVVIQPKLVIRSSTVCISDTTRDYANAMKPTN